ncbi:TauD/TfdA family dioxygenase [Enterovibrio makurazakiensis]|uniref:TauD/TfdA family dioxygenase n=1 Tax=Enterovibrio gelatinilyticus TaxID=2899819 RepID=A0ABT5R5H1_9GAMM|nr:TauD/TfdA family dioxygenase [Enterovibrio sp. ZSDZ42]MDD1794727.1 TauD/TfdA family dioxygenase [Enterovibrio sp. ZSDZ42]
MLTITPLTPHIGAIIDGVALASCSDDDFAQIYQAFLNDKVVFFRDQYLSPDEQLALARRFGELEAPHPFFPHVDGFPQVSVIETTPGNPPGKSYWHTDMTWQKAPPKCSVLCAQHLPDEGGDTIWTSMEAVYQSLPNAMKQSLQGLTATHAVHGFAGSRFDKTNAKGESKVAQIAGKMNGVQHPLVVRHPETDHPSLYINEQFCQYIDNLDLECVEINALSEKNGKDGDNLLSSLFSLSREEAFQVRFTWEAGSVAIWDNRCTQHFAVTDYGDKPRKLHRVVVKGEKPAAMPTLDV